MADVRKDIIQEQIEIWRSEYYGTEDKPGLKDTISKKREEGKNLTSLQMNFAFIFSPSTFDDLPYMCS